MPWDSKRAMPWALLYTPYYIAKDEGYRNNYASTFVQFACDFFRAN